MFRTNIQLIPSGLPTLLFLFLNTQTIHASCSLDVDNNGQQDASTDGQLIIRHQFGFSGLALTQDAIGTEARRSDPEDIRTYLDSEICRDYMDVDHDQNMDALTDGLLIIRHLSGIRGAALTDGVVASDAGRSTPEAITQWLDSPPEQNNTDSLIFTKQIIDTDVGQVHAVAAADFDSDQDMDFVATDFVAGKLYWYRNEGGDAFTKFTLDPDLGGAYPATVADVNGDGKTDVLAAGYTSDTVAWYESDGEGNFTRHDVDTQADGAHSVVAEDMNRDGNMDLLVATQDAGTILWYENDGNHVFDRHVIDQKAWGAKYAVAADLDGDNDTDVIAVHFFMPLGEQLTWYENDGNQVFTERIIASETNAAYFVSTTDIDGDHDADILTAVSHDSRPPELNPRLLAENDDHIVLYRNEGFGHFTKQVIDANAVGARTAVPVDIDADGDNDIIAGIRTDNTVALYRNDGSGQLTKEVIDAAAPGAYGVAAADMDGDGRLDVLSASRNSNAVAIHYRE